MTSRDFCYWLQGLFELSPDTKNLTEEQVRIIRNHLNMVFIHEIDPGFGGKMQQDALTAAHNEGRPTRLSELMKC